MPPLAATEVLAQRLGDEVLHQAILADAQQSHPVPKLARDARGSFRGHMLIEHRPVIPRKRAKTIAPSRGWLPMSPQVDHPEAG